MTNTIIGYDLSIHRKIYPNKCGKRVKLSAKGAVNWLNICDEGSYTSTILYMKYVIAYEVISIEGSYRSYEHESNIIIGHDLSIHRKIYLNKCGKRVKLSAKGAVNLNVITDIIFRFNVIRNM